MCEPIEYKNFSSEVQNYDCLISKYNVYFGVFSSLFKLANLKLEDFIRHRNLIIYGGTAIDYALRLKGEQIYPDEDLPYADYDVFSSNHQKDAYDYAELLFSEKEEYKETRAINALNIYTIKVGIGFNNFVLDCAYKPKDMLSKIPTLEYQGMKIVHPHFQYLDMHRALSIPYEGAPREVIFHRWKKDITRFNKLFNKYPICAEKSINAAGLKNQNIGELTTKYLKSVENKVPKWLLDVFHNSTEIVAANGFLAYSIFYDDFKKKYPNKKIKAPESSIYMKNGDLYYSANIQEKLT